MFMLSLLSLLVTAVSLSHTSHLSLWHSGAEPDLRNGTVPECWNGWLDKVRATSLPRAL
jgi:hypothetical protein